MKQATSRLIGLLIILLLIGTIPGGLRGQELRRQTESRESAELARKTGFVQAVARAKDSVVSIQGEKQYEARELQKSENFSRSSRANNPTRENVTHIGMGTGVIIDERGYILTNYHVVKGLLKIQITTSDGTTYRDVEFIRNDLGTDLAILKIDPIAPLRKIAFGRSDNVFLAEEVVAIGNPFGYQASVSRGIVSGLHRPLKASDTLYYEDVIQTDAAINPGNSGGPLLNIDGEMIGLNAAVREGAENIAFAIPVDIVSEVTDRMIQESVARLRHHGLTLKRIPHPEVSRQGGAYGPEASECVVESVAPKSPAAQAGIQKGDVIVSCNDHTIQTPLDFTCSLIGVQLMDEIALNLQRNRTHLDTSLAFSGRSGDRSEELTIRAGRPIRSEKSFEAAGLAPSYAQASDPKEVTEAFQTVSRREEKKNDVSGYAQEVSVSSPKEGEESRNDYLWKNLGLRIEPVSKADYQRQFPDLMVISMGKFKIYPTGGVRVTEIAGTSLFQTQQEKLREGDLLFGFVIGSNEENRWGVTSSDDLCYIAERWQKLAEQQGNETARIYLIRNETAYFLDIELVR